MIDLLSVGNSRRKISIKYILLTFFVCISMVAWLGISDLRADENNLEDNSNDAQAQRLENVAREAALQDEYTNHDAEFYKTEIEVRRESGMGWGEIVHTLNDDFDLNLHPSVLGLGQSKKFSEEAVQSSKHSSMQSGNNQGQGLAVGHSKDGSSTGGGRGGGNGGGKGGGKK